MKHLIKITRRVNQEEERKIHNLIHVDDSQVEYKYSGGSYFAYLSGSYLTQADTIEDLAEYVNELFGDDEEEEE